MKKTKRNIPGFNVKDMDRSVRPQDDFYLFANGGWLKRNTIPPTEARWGGFTILRYATEKELKSVVGSLLRQKRTTKGSPAQLVRDFFRSGVDTAGRERAGTAPLKPLLDRIEKISNKKDLLSCIAHFHQLGIAAPWALGVDQDIKESSRYALYLSQSGLSLPDRDYYLKHTPEFVRVRTAYRTHVEKMFGLIGHNAAQAANSASAVLQMETELARASMDKVSVRDPEKIYHKKTPAQLPRLAPNIFWRTYTKDAHIPRVPYVVVMQPKFLTAVSKLFDTAPLSVWKVYLTWQVLDEAAPFLTQKFARTHFDFYGKTLLGSKKMKSQWRRVLAVVNAGLGEALGRLYVERYFSREKKRTMNELVNDLFVVYEEHIKALDWMSDITKQKAIKKLHAMDRKIGYPKQWKSYKGLTIRPDDYFGNVLRSSRLEYRRELKKLGRPINQHEWFMTPQTVNAYYSSSMNDIVFPAAILQPPFFNFKADDAINYGAIGSLIGHEMTHGFDDQGAKFDARGNLKRWWTPADKKRFEQKGRALVKQYNTYRVAGGVAVNGKLTLGENIADLGGLVIAYDAFQKHLHKVGRKAIAGFTPEQRFFFGFAAQGCELCRPEFEKLTTLNDPHSPAPTRVNGPLSNFTPFYQAFGVSSKDKLYRRPSERTEIW